MKTKKHIISNSGIINGRGSDRYRWVSALSAEEREEVRRGKSGAIVLIRDTNPRSGCAFKRVTYYGGRYGHCNYTVPAGKTLNEETGFLYIA